ncbi:MAG: Na/Pi cotransporter family protein, partial [Deltaproteobacteria bacterium]|nr:Na/Pi cotransporter family protein [Deltaproteobacteria bacterium]
MVVDHLRRQILHYLWKLSSLELAESQTRRLFLYTATADDIESIGDHAINIVELARSKHHRNIEFSALGEAELKEIEALVFDNLRMAKLLLDHPDFDLVRMITEQEALIDVKTKEAHENHLIRFYNRVCQAEAGPVFIEYLIQLERVSDHCQNIADYATDMDGR